MKPQLHAIMGQFDMQGIPASILPFGSGHINDSYRVINKDKSKPDYLLQRINHNVFHDVKGMMDNIQGVTNYLYEKYKKAGIEDARQRVLCVIGTKSGDLYVEKDGSYWRLYLLLEGYRSWDVPESNEQIYEGARAFGQFTSDLNEYDATQLNITIPYFHHMPKRLHRFQEVIKDLKKMSNEELEAISYVKKQADDMCLLQRLLDQGKLPLRVTHNDTKFNNVLFNDDNQARCVIDLDTVMPGLIHYDFGDGARTGTSTASEDETDLSLIDIDTEAFTAYSNGFLDATRTIITKNEAETLVNGATMITFIMGLRFLTDYFDGSKYYKIAHPRHNLERAKCQLELSKKMINRKPDLVSIVNNFL